MRLTRLRTAARASPSFSFFFRLLYFTSIAVMVRVCARAAPSLALTVCCALSFFMHHGW